MPNDLMRRAAVLLFLLPGACVNRSTISQGEQRAVPDDRSTRVTAAELSRYAGGQSLLEALRRLRPTFLDSRGSHPMVTVDGSAAGDQSILSTIPVSHVFEVRLVKAGSPGSMPIVRPNGDVVVGDLILVLTRKQ